MLCPYRLQLFLNLQQMEQQIYTKEKHEFGQVHSQASLQSWRRQEPAVDASKRTEQAEFL